MPHPSWNDSYASGEPLPWDTGTPDPMLVELIEARAITLGRALDVGCGSGTNAIYLAEHGFEVVGVDISPVAIENARAKAHGIPVIYYGVPQLWAWAGWRIKKMRRCVDYVLCKLPFEEGWYRERGCNATFVGHPYFDQLRAEKLDATFIERLKDGDGPLVAILPGSRTQEVKSNLKYFLKAARLVRASVPNARPPSCRARSAMSSTNPLSSSYCASKNLWRSLNCGPVTFQW